MPRLYDTNYAFSEDYSDEITCEITLTEKQWHIVSTVLAISGGLPWLWEPALSDSQEAEVSAIVATFLEVTCGE